MSTINPVTPRSTASTSTTRALLAFVLFACAQWAWHGAHASDFLLQQQLSAIASGEGVPNGLFGWSVAVDDDIAVVADVGTLESPGRIRTYRRSGTTWTRLPGHDLDIPGDSGALMAFHDGSLIFSAYRSSAPSRGYLFIHRFTEDGWVQEYGAASSSLYYDSVATQGYIAVAGEAGYDGAAGNNQGRVRILRRQSNDQWQSEQLLPTTPEAGAYFGFSVAIVSGAIVVGAPTETVTHGGSTYTHAGAAYVYELTIDTWNEVARLVEPSGNDLTESRFGTAVAISGRDPGTPDRLLVSRPSIASTSRAGIVRTYTRTGGSWTTGETISAPTPSSTDGFGASLALDGNWGVVGAQTSNAAATRGGAIFIARFDDAFHFLGMSERTDPLAGDNDSMGVRVAVDRDGPTVVVGNLAADLYGNANQGVVLVGHSDSGTVPALSRAIDIGQGLGNANAGIVAIDGDTLLIGAYRENIGLQHDRGAVHEYRRMPDGHYAYQSRILAPDGMSGDLFGYRMAIQGDTALISSIGRPLGGEAQAGAVYVFHRDAGLWSLEAQLLPPVVGYEITFGFSLAFDGTTAFIGEFGENTSVYERSSGGLWTPVQTLPHRAWSVQVHGDAAFLADSNTNNNIGDVAIYARNGGQWQPQGALNGSAADQGFGREIHLSGDNLLAVSSSTPTTPVLLYRLAGATWLPDASLLPDDLVANTYCSHVAATATTLAIGCALSGSPGAVYVFEKSAGLWQQSQKLLLDPNQVNDTFGLSLAWHTNGNLVAGAPLRDVDFLDQGAVYVYAGDALFRDGFE